MQLRRLLEPVVAYRSKLRLVGLVAAGWSTCACMYVMLGRFGYPHELEWMTGAVLDHVERVQKGLPVYARPTASWIPFLYPPFYYWLSAAAARLLPLVMACRAISIAATFVQAACIARLALRRGATPYWTAIGVGAFFAAFSIVDFWYDLERPDSLFVALVLAGAVVLDEVGGIRGAVVSGALLGLAFLTKQPATLFILGGASALLLRRQWSRAAALLASSGVVAGVLVAQQIAATDGWFGYYVLSMPLSHGMSWSLIPAFFFEDLPHAWAWAIATLALVAGFAARRREDDAVFIAFLGASFVATMTSRLHIGGWANVLSFWTAFGSAAIAVYGSRLEAALDASGDPIDGAASALLPAVVAGQLLACAYAPGDRIPARSREHRFQELIADIRKLETKGEVIALGRGHLTAVRHFHVAALIDVVTVEHALPEDLLSALREQRFAAIVIDNLDDLWMPLHPEIDGQLFFVVTANYSIERRIDERIQAPVLGWAARPRWVLVPRKERLDESARTLLARRSLTELNLAQIGHPFDPDHVNDLALGAHHLSDEAERHQDFEANASK